MGYLLQERVQRNAREVARCDSGAKLCLRNAWLHPPLHNGPHLRFYLYLTAKGGHAATAPALLLHGPTSLESESSEPVSSYYSTISTYLTTLPSSVTTNSSMALPRNP